MPPKPTPREPKTSPKGEDAFPEAGSSSLISIAKKVYMANEVKQAVDLARKLKPNGPGILNAANKWYKAAGIFGDSLEHLDYAWYNYGIIWKGDAFDAFTSYMRFNVNPATTNNSNVLFNIGNEVINLYNTAIAGYHDAVVAIGTTLKKAQEIDSSDNDALTTMLTDYINNEYQRRQTIANALATEMGDVAKLASQVELFRKPGRFPEGAKNKNKWTYDP